MNNNKQKQTDGLKSDRSAPSCSLSEYLKWPLRPELKHNQETFQKFYHDMGLRIGKKLAESQEFELAMIPLIQEYLSDVKLKICDQTFESHMVDQTVG